MDDNKETPTEPPFTKEEMVGQDTNELAVLESLFGIYANSKEPKYAFDGTLWTSDKIIREVQMIRSEARAGLETAEHIAKLPNTPIDLRKLVGQIVGYDRKIAAFKP